MQYVGTSSLCPKRSILAINSQISTTKVWPNHSQPCGQPGGFRILAGRRVPPCTNVVEIIFA